MFENVWNVSFNRFKKQRQTEREREREREREKRLRDCNGLISKMSKRRARISKVKKTFTRRNMQRPIRDRSREDPKKLGRAWNTRLFVCAWKHRTTWICRLYLSSRAVYLSVSKFLLPVVNLFLPVGSRHRKPSRILRANSSVRADALRWCAAILPPLHLLHPPPWL